MKRLEIRTLNEIDEARVGQLLHLVGTRAGSAAGSELTNFTTITLTPTESV